MSETLPRPGTPPVAGNAADAALKAMLTGTSADPNAGDGFLDFGPMPGAVRSANVTPDPGPGSDTQTSEEAPPAEAAPETPKDGGAAPNGDAATQPAGEMPVETVDKILAKYGTPENVAKGYVNLQRLQTATAEEKKALEAQLLKAQEIAETAREFFEEKEGKLVLRVDKAGERLRQARVPVQSAVPTVDEKIVAAVVRKEWSDFYADKIDEDALDQFMAASEPKIQEITAERVAKAKQALRDADVREYLEVGQSINTFFKENPKFDAVADEMDEWFDGIPDNVRRAVLKANPAILKRIGQAEYTQKNLRAMVQEAFEAGKKSGGASPEPSGPSSPSSGGRQGALRSGGEDRDTNFKAQMLGAGKFPTIESLFGK